MALFRPLASSFLLMLVWCATAAQHPGNENSEPDPTTGMADSAKVVQLNKLAYQHYLISPQKAMQFGYRAVELSRAISFPAGEAEGLRQIGIVLWAQGNYTSALRNFMTALKLAERIKDRQVIADVTGNLGLLYYGLMDYDQALAYHRSSLEMQRSLDNIDREAAALNNLGDVLRSQRNYDSAIRCYQFALAKRKETGYISAVATNMRNIGNVFEEQGRFDEALSQYRQSMQISDSLKEKRGMSQNLLSIGSVYRKLGQHDLAEKNILGSLVISKQAGFKGSQRDAYLLLSEISESRKDFPKAFAYLRQFVAFRDSVINLEVSSEIASQRLQYEMEKKQSEIDLLKKDAELKETDLARKNTFLVSGALTLVVVISVASILFRNYSNQKNLNALLAMKNTEIERQHQEITLQRDELIRLNEEIRAQQEDLTSSHDSLAEKNAAIAGMNERITAINRNLEKLVAERTRALEQQNQQLIEYAFVNAHKLRGPLARVMGLTHLLTSTPHTDDQKEMFGLLEDSAAELDEVTRSITTIVDKGINAFPFEKPSTHE